MSKRFTNQLYDSFCDAIIVCIFQIRVRVSDGGTPPKTDTTVVGVTVTRNLKKPVFDPVSYSFRGLETLNLGSVVATVSARDEDLRVRYSGVRFWRATFFNAACHLLGFSLQTTRCSMSWWEMRKPGVISWSTA